MLALLFASVAATAAAAAGIYKCARTDGTVIYQEGACAAGAELRDLVRDPPTVSVVPFRALPAGEPPRGERPPRERPPRATSRSQAREPKAPARTGNPAERKFLVPGISEGEVVARVGRPDIRTPAGRRTVRWTYLPAAEDPQTITMLTFERGRLEHVERKVVSAP
jgi:hypothetical protein